MMRARDALAAVILLTVPLSCSRSKTPHPARDGASPSPAAVSRHESRYRGLYTATGSDSGTIALCAGVTLPVRDGTGGELRRAYDALGGGPGSPVFVEIRAESIVGSVASQAAHLAVLELVRASPTGEGAGCAEPPASYRFRASGNEPFWSATVGADSIVFEQPEEPRRTAAPIVEAEGRAGTWTFRAAMPGAQTREIRVVLTPGRCSDSMSGALTSYSAEVLLDGRPLSGCAREGDVAATP